MVRCVSDDVSDMSDHSSSTVVEEGHLRHLACHHCWRRPAAPSPSLWQHMLWLSRLPQGTSRRSSTRPAKATTRMWPLHRRLLVCLVQTFELMFRLMAFQNRTVSAIANIDLLTSVSHTPPTITPFVTRFLAQTKPRTLQQL